MDAQTREVVSDRRNVAWSPENILVDTVARMQQDLADIRAESRQLRTPGVPPVVHTPRKVAFTTTKVPQFGGTISSITCWGPLMEGYLKWKGFGYFVWSQQGVWSSFHHPASRVYFLVKSVTHTWFFKTIQRFQFHCSPGGGGHSHICPVQVCAAVNTPLFYLTRA